MKELIKNKKWLMPIIFSVLILVGLIIPFMFGFFKDVVKQNETMDIVMCLCRHSIDLTISVYLLIIGYLCLKWYIKNLLVKPYEDVVYLLEKKDNNWIFIDRKGNALIKDDEEYISKSYYKVLRTNNMVNEILGKSDEEFEIVQIKESYWTKFCSILGGYKSMIILPFLYFFLIQAICKMVVVPFFDKIRFFVLFLFISFILVYDWVYKEKEKSDIKSDKIIEVKGNLGMRLWVLGATFQIILSFLVTLFFVFLIVSSGDLFSLAFILFFLFTMLSSLFGILAKLYNNQNIIARYEKMHSQFVKILLITVSIVGLLWGVTYDNEIISLAVIVICVMAFILLNPNNEENKDKK